MFTYLTGFRAAEVRPLHISGKTKECVIVTSATRKKGQAEVLKLREWSTKLRVVIARQTDAPDAAPIPVHQLRRPGVHTVGYGVGMAGRNVRMDRVIRHQGGACTRSQARGRAGIYPSLKEGTESDEVRVRLPTGRARTIFFTAEYPAGSHPCQV